jgi:hypothetical protein
MCVCGALSTGHPAHVRAVPPFLMYKLPGPAPNVQASSVETYSAEWAQLRGSCQCNSTCTKHFNLSQWGLLEVADLMSSTIAHKAIVPTKHCRALLRPSADARQLPLCSLQTIVEIVSGAKLTTPSSESTPSMRILSSRKALLRAPRYSSSLLSVGQTRQRDEPAAWCTA